MCKQKSVPVWNPNAAILDSQSSNVQTTAKSKERWSESLKINLNSNANLNTYVAAN